MLISAAVPGSGVFACIARAIASGFKDTLYIISGILIGNIVFLVIAILDMATAAQALGQLFNVVKYLGALYLIWLSLWLWMSAPDAVISSTETASTNSTSNFLTGLVVPFSNSSVIFFYVSLLPTFINVNKLNLTGSLVAILTISVALFVVLIIYSCGAARARNLFKSQTDLKKFNRGAGTLMIGTGVCVAAQ